MFNNRKEEEEDIPALPPIPIQPSPTMTSSADAEYEIFHDLLARVQGLEEQLKDAKKIKKPQSGSSKHKGNEVDGMLLFTPACSSPPIN